MLSHIIADMEQRDGIRCNTVSPIDGGWQNRLWHVDSCAGSLLVKQFSPNRYRRRERLEAIEAALQRQVALQRNGIPCPEVFLHQGQALRWLEDGTVYMLMRYCAGHNETPETVTLPQLRDLGSVCARMHLAFATLPEAGVKGYPIDSTQLLNGLWSHYRTQCDLLDGSPALPAAFRQAVMTMEPILQSLTPAFFDRLPRGITHEDFTPDNLLFDGDHVTAVIDFDRNCYSFPLHDVGRALLSFAWHNGQLDPARIWAFQEGYACHAPLSIADISDALRISWCIEVLWWVQPSCFPMPLSKATRYRDEILWLTSHWFDLDRISMQQPPLR